VVVAGAVVASATVARGTPSPRALDEPVVRVALAIRVPQVRISGSSVWRIFEADGASLVAEGEVDEAWRFEQRGARLRAVRPDGATTDYHESPLIVRPAAWGGFVVHGRRRYRGELLVHATEGGITVVNHLGVDDYLKGVVPLEIGMERRMDDFAAVEAQAVAARSYAYIRLGRDPRRLYDLRPTVADQAYGGVNAETSVATRAVESTAGLVMKYDGRLVNAPYHSTCGGSTAEAPEVWPTGSEPFLQRVSDRVPGSDRFYCDISPRFRWSRELSGDRLDAAVRRYLRDYASVPARGAGAVRSVSIVNRTASGRVGAVEITTASGSYTVRGNDARFVLRAPEAEILNSSWFAVESVPDGSGRVARITLRGAGFGHGVGMCQWGAIGRARAGEDFRTILATYFRGTIVEPVN
jgi:stage II sporulation protein D